MPSDNMDTLHKIFHSEFFWGVVIGLVLAMVVAAFSIMLDNRRRHRVFAAFAQDSINSICSYIQNLEDNRTRNRIIHYEFLEVITAEVGIFGRNREHLVNLDDNDLRNDVRDFFNRVAAHVVQIQINLRTVSEQMHIANSYSGGTAVGTLTPQKNAEQNASQALDRAHEACDRLRDMMTKKDNLNSRLAPLAKKLFGLF